MSKKDPITVDNSAVERVAAMRRDPQNQDFTPESYLRIAVEGGGCSGFQYRIEPDNTVNEDDTIYSEAVVIDEMSLNFLKGTTIRFVDTMMGANFEIDNPNVISSCGCQVSFDIDPDALVDA